MKKLFVVRKLVMAKDASEAIKLERKQRADDVWVDEDWKQEHLKQNKDFGFKG